MRDAALRGMLPNKFDQKIYCLERFIDALVEADVAERPKPPNKAPTVLERLQAEYEAYLREQRGLTEVTMYHCVRFLDRFMKFHFGATLGDRNDITPAVIVKFLREVIGRKTTYRIVKALDDTVGLRTFRLRSAVIDILDGKVELIFIAFGIAAIQTALQTPSVR